MSQPAPLAELPTITVAAVLAYNTANHIRDRLADMGFDPDHDFPGLHGDVTVSDEPFVTLGRVTPRIIARLVTLASHAPELDATERRP